MNLGVVKNVVKGSKKTKENKNSWSHVKSKASPSHIIQTQSYDCDYAKEKPNALLEGAYTMVSKLRHSLTLKNHTHNKGVKRTP